jgi:hypothetical protein
MDRIGSPWIKTAARSWNVSWWIDQWTFFFARENGDTLFHTFSVSPYFCHQILWTLRGSMVFPQVFTETHLDVGKHQLEGAHPPMWMLDIIQHSPVKLHVLLFVIFPFLFVKCMLYIYDIWYMCIYNWVKTDEFDCMVNCHMLIIDWMIVTWKLSD